MGITMDQDAEEMREFVRELTALQGDIRSFVGYLMGGQPGVQDVAQEVNLVLWEKRADFELGTNFKAWAFATARYMVLSRRRKQKKDGILVFDDSLIDTLADEWQEDKVDQERLLVALEHCLDGLNPTDATLLKQRYTSPDTLERFATTAARSAGALRVRLFRLRAALKQCVLRQLAEGGAP